jgi:hypothetical protein
MLVCGVHMVSHAAYRSAYVWLVQRVAEKAKNAVEAQLKRLYRRSASRRLDLSDLIARRDNGVSTEGSLVVS